MATISERPDAGPAQTKPSNTNIFNASISNKTLYKGSNLPFVIEEIGRLTKDYFEYFPAHSTEEARQLSLQPKVRRS